MSLSYLTVWCPICQNLVFLCQASWERSHIFYIETSLPNPLLVWAMLLHGFNMLSKIDKNYDVSPGNCYCHTKSEYEVTWQKAKCLNMNGCVAVRLLWCRLYHEWATHLQRRTRQICLQIGDDGGDMGSQGFYVTTDVTCENNDIIFNAHVKGFTTTALAGPGQKKHPDDCEASWYCELWNTTLYLNIYHTMYWCPI